MNISKTSIFLMIALLAVSFVLSGCSGFGIGTPSNYQRKYYQGYNSLDMKFATASPPDIFYYDPQSSDNEIPIVINVQNKGAADTYGVIFIQGYDPHIMQIAGGQTPGSGNIQIGGSGSSFYFSVSNVYIGLSGGGSNANLGFTSPNGNIYGLNAFTSNGQLKSIMIRMNPGRIGFGLGQKALTLFSTNLGWNAPIALEGDTIDTPGGGTEVYDFPTYIYYLPESLEQFPQTIMATACFDYATRSTTMMCIDPKPNSNTVKACVPRSVSPSGGQGGPVAITRVDQQSSSAKTVFTIYIHHYKQSSLDELYDLNSLYKCNPSSASLVKATDKNVVYLGYAELSGRPLICASDGRIRLDDSGNGQISCSAIFDGLTTDAYTAPLEVELWYGYSKSIYKTLQIKRV